MLYTYKLLYLFQKTSEEYSAQVVLIIM